MLLYFDKLMRQVQNTGHRSQVIVLLTQKVSQTPLKANLRPNKFLFTFCVSKTMTCDL